MSPEPESTDGEQPGAPDAPVHRELPDHLRGVFGDGEAADSAGQPWAGRSFEANPAADDDGSADPALLDALISFHEGEGSASAVVEAVRGARLLIPLLAHAGDVGRTAEGHLVDKTQELSIVTVQAPDGRTVLPAFTSVETMRSWNPLARPVPAAGPRVALAAASEETQLVVIDPANPSEFVLRRPAVFALGTGSPWLPPQDDPAVREAFEASIAEEPDAQRISLAGGDPRSRLQAEELVVRLRLRRGLTQDQLRDTVTRISGRWAASPVITGGVDSMTLQLVQD